MKRLAALFKEESEYKRLAEDVRRKGRTALATGLTGTAEAVFIAALASDVSGTLVVCAGDETVASALEKELSENVSGVWYYPPRELLLSDADASGHGWEQIRVNTLAALAAGKCRVLVTTAEALMQYTVPKDVLLAHSMEIKPGAKLPYGALVKFLSDGGFTRCDMVESRSQFAVRGGIVDVFPAQAERPVRIEFFGDEVDTLTQFDVFTQRRGDALTELSLYPCRELIFSAEAKERTERELELASERIAEKIAQSEKQILKEKKRDPASAKYNALVSDAERAKHTAESVKRARDRLSAGLDVPFADVYLSCVYEKPATVFDYLGEDARIYIKDHRVVKSAADAYEFRINEATEALLAKGLVSGEKARYAITCADFFDFCAYFGGVVQNNLSASVGDLKYDGLYDFNVKHGAQAGYDVALLCDDVRHYERLGYRVFIAVGRKESAAPLAEMLSERGIKAYTGDGFMPKPSQTVIICAKVSSGYESPKSKTVLLCDVKTQSGKLAKPQGAVINAKRREIARKYRDSTQKLISYADLSVGDYVVHSSYGIGIFCGIESMTDKNVTKDYIKIKYAGTDVLFVPVSSLDLVSKYIGAGSDDAKLKLSKLSGNEWSRAKSSVKAQVRDMAKKLVKLYAERLNTEGFAFSPDTEWQQEFESGFEYAETEGQLAATEEIKRDMESAHPMDRLLCGDVGFGKTEVALRAAFKAVSDGKQVAILVPTTILAWQHYRTIVARMSGYPVKAALISRFVQSKQQGEILSRLRRGDVDIIVGTHRLLQKDVEFKDLGLLIVDEEQRFGVEQKEYLKSRFRTVDVLTLSATPIPRTLNMAMSGIRDMSILDEAPQDRYPVQTYVCEYDDGIANDAIARELARGGQVFYLVNRVASLRTVAAHISASHPDARVAYAHGGMEEDGLSRIWEALVAGEIDVLVCTTIIETGVDVPNANTLIIEHAERMGLSQLHQIRGRVGRSSRRAFAYFFYPAGRTLTEDQTKRLTAVRDYTEFGAGFKIAMRDLEIRGAGNVLGAEQHGQIAAVGYDLYVKILDEAVRELKIDGNYAEAADTPSYKEVTLDLPESAFIPKDYIPTERMRIDVYRKIASIDSKEEMENVIDELCDRFADVPPQVMSLIGIAYVKSLAQRASIDSVRVTDGNIVIFPSKFDPEVWGRLSSEKKYYGKILLSPSGIPHVTYRCSKDEAKSHVKILEGVLTEVLKLMKKA